MTIDQIIALAASIGACFSAIATFWTVREMKNQRDNSVLPDLVLSQVFFNCSKRSSLSRLAPAIWERTNNHHEKIRASKEHPVYDRYPFYIDVHNIGLGAARDIKISFSFSIDDCINLLNESSKQLYPSTFFEIDRCLSFMDIDGVRKTVSDWSREQILYFDYLLPSATGINPTKIKVPIAYLYVVSEIFFQFLDTGKLRVDVIPSLVVNFTYTDIHKNRYSKKREIIFHSEGFSKEKIHGFFKIK